MADGKLSTNRPYASYRKVDGEEGEVYLHDDPKQGGFDVKIEPGEENNPHLPREPKTPGPALPS